jgi:hypothetical protein
MPGSALLRGMAPELALYAIRSADLQVSKCRTKGRLYLKTYALFLYNNAGFYDKACVFKNIVGSRPMPKRGPVFSITSWDGPSFSIVFSRLNWKGE